MAKSSKDERDLVALLVLDCELPSLRKSVELAEAIADAIRFSPVRHPVLAFALDKAPASVAENLLLRIPEVLDVLERVRKRINLSAVFEGSGRERRPIHPAFKLAYQIRQERVAHRVKVGLDRQTAWPKVSVEYGTVWSLLRQVLDELGALVHEIKGAGALDGVTPDARVARREYVHFSASDVEALMAKADQGAHLGPKPQTDKGTA